MLTSLNQVRSIKYDKYLETLLRTLQSNLTTHHIVLSALAKKPSLKSGYKDIHVCGCKYLFTNYKHQILILFTSVAQHIAQR